MSLSKENYNIILKMQQNEITEHSVYTNLAKTVKKEEDKKILQKIADEEYAHYNIWKKYTGKELSAQRLKVFKFLFLSKIFGYTFVIKIMEKGEKNAENIYQKLEKDIPEAKSIAEDEDKHEEYLISILDEDRLQYVGSMVLGINDALVELTGTLAGLTFALQNNRLVALSGIITGISATLSMASSEYLSSKAEGNKNAFTSCLYTGVMYIIAVTALVVPYLCFPNDKYVYALITMLLIVVFIIFFFTYYISVAKSMPFRKRFTEMATISLTVAAISFLVGLIVKSVLKIDI